MKFAYSVFRPKGPGAATLEAWRPVVKARTFGAKRTLRIDMLIDSGSDESTVPARVLDAIGVQYTVEKIASRCSASGTSS